MSAQQDSDVKAAKSAKKEVTKEVRQVQKADEVKDAKATKRMVEKTSDEKAILRDDQKGNVQMKKKKATLKDADQKAKKIKKDVDY